MVELSEFIQTCDKCLDDDICDFLVDLFENASENSLELNLTELSKSDEKIKEVHNKLINLTYSTRDLYYDFVDKRVFPEKHALEQFKIKKFNNDETGSVSAHSDVFDYSDARRFLAFFWFLNDVEEGGEIRFRDSLIFPEKGSLAMFPPFWMFPYKQNMPVSNPKYLLTTYLHYK